MKSLERTIILIVCLVVSDSIIAQKKQKEPPGFVYGNIHGVSGLRHVYIQKLGKVYVGPFGRPKTEALDDGTFYFKKVEPGDYYLAGFSIRGGDTFWIPYTKETVQDALFAVSSDAAQFMGAYQISNVSNGILKQGSFEINPSKKPSEKEIITAILKQLKDSPWVKPLDDRLHKI